MSSRNEVVRVTVNIFGEEYSIKGTEPQEYIEKMAEMVDSQMRALYQRNPNLGVSRLAILTALNMADELSKLRNDYDQLLSQRRKRKEEKNQDY